MQKQICVGMTLLFFLTVPSHRSQTLSATVEEDVVDLGGSAIPRAQVCALRVVSGGGRLPCSQADGKGRFSVTIEEPGKYLIAAWNEKEGYAPVFNPAFGVPAVPLPEVQVDAGRTRHSVVIRLGPRLGRFIVRVVDVETGQPVSTGHFEVQVRSDHSAFVRQAPYSDGWFELVVPSWLFSLKVSSPGYQDWYGSGSKEEPEVFIVQLGGRLEMTVSMRPVSKR